MKHKNILMFIVLLFVISIITGIIYGINNKVDLSSYISSLSSNNFMFLNSFIVIVLFFISTISLIGIVLQSIYISLNGLSIGYIISEFYMNYKIKGIIFSLIDITINKIFFILVYIYLFVITYIYLIRFIKNIIGSNKEYVISLIRPLINKYIVILITVFIYDLLLYLIGNNILNYFTFML